MAGAFERMSSREKAMVSGLIGVVLVLGVGGFYLYLSSQVSDLELEVVEAQDTLAQIRALAPKYMERTRETNRFRGLAKANDSLALDREINRIAKAISFEQRNSVGEPTGKDLNLANVLNYPGKEEKFLGPKVKSRSKKKSKEKVGYYRKDEPLRVGDHLPFDQLYQFLDRIEMTEKMLFVTRIDMRRLRRDGRLAQSGSAFTVSTYVYRGGADDTEAAADAAPDKTGGK